MDNLSATLLTGWYNALYYIGIDIAKKAHEVCFMTENGYVLDGNSFKIPNTGSAIDKLQAMLDRYDLSSTNAVVGMEATGHYWLVLYSWLKEQGFDIKVINPLVTEGYRKMHIRKIKNDRIDAAVVAKVLILGEYQATSTVSRQANRSSLTPDLMPRCMNPVNSKAPGRTCPGADRRT